MELHEIIQKFDADIIMKINEEKKRKGSDDEDLFFDAIIGLRQLLNYTFVKRMSGGLTRQEKINIFTSVALAVNVAFFTLSEDEKQEIATEGVEGSNKAMENVMSLMRGFTELNYDALHIEADMVQ